MISSWSDFRYTSAESLVHYKYRMTRLTAFQWFRPGLFKYLPNMPTMYARYRRVQTWAYTRLPTAEAYGIFCISLCSKSFLGHWLRLKLFPLAIRVSGSTILYEILNSIQLIDDNDIVSWYLTSCNVFLVKSCYNILNDGGCRFLYKFIWKSAYLWKSRFLDGLYVMIKFFLMPTCKKGVGLVLCNVTFVVILWNPLNTFFCIVMPLELFGTSLFMVEMNFWTVPRFLRFFSCTMCLNLAFLIKDGIL